MRHAILSTYGEPAAARFGDQLRYSWRILLGLTRTVAPIPRPVLPLIALSRARGRVASWKAEGYASPLEPITEAQRDALQAVLDAREPGGWRVHLAYEFRDPTLSQVLAGVPEGEAVRVVPMYAADSAFTHDLARDAVRALNGRGAAVTVASPLDLETQAALHVAHVREELARAGVTPGGDSALVLAAHGTLVNPPRPYETGERETRALAQLVSEAVRAEFPVSTIAWLNHRFGGTWTSPAVDEALADLRARGVRQVVYYPFGFLADNAESQLEGRVALRDAGFHAAVHLPCLNASDALARAIADQLSI